MEEILQKLMELEKETNDLDKEFDEYLASIGGKPSEIEHFRKLGEFKIRLKILQETRDKIHLTYNKNKGVLRPWKR